MADTVIILLQAEISTLNNLQNDWKVMKINQSFYMDTLTNGKQNNYF